MYKLLLVDDEPAIRAGLRNHFDWMAYGIEIAGEANNGVAALELLEHQGIDIVMTDVRMAKMDGIALSREIRKRFQDIKIVFISGYDDTDYLKSALQLNAMDYIFKPVNMDELQKVVEKVIAELKASEVRQLVLQDMQVKMRESLPLLRTEFFMALIRREITSDGALEERSRFLELRLPADAGYGVIVISVDNSASVIDSYSEKGWRLISYAVQNIGQELIDKHMEGYIFQSQTEEYTGILRAFGSAEMFGDRLIALASDIRDNLLRWLRISVTIGVGQQVKQLRSLADSYDQAREIAARRWYLGSSRVITVDSLEENNSGGYSFGQKQREQLLACLKAADESQLRLLLDDIFSGLSRNRPDGINYGRNVCLQMLLLSDQLLLGLNIDSPLIESMEDQWKLLLTKETIIELHGMLEGHMLSVCQRIQEKRTGKTFKLAERVKEIIEERYSDNQLTVGLIAKEVFLTDSYVSLLFKQETGQTINDYLTEARIEKAKSLLSESDKRLNDICQEVGFSDIGYFRKLFKRHTGLLPKDYRQRFM